MCEMRDHDIVTSTIISSSSSCCVTDLLQHLVNVRAVGFDSLLGFLSSASGFLSWGGLLGGLLGGCLGHGECG
jgi:hypothetical protein